MRRKGSNLTRLDPIWVTLMHTPSLYLQHQIEGAQSDFEVARLAFRNAVAARAAGRGTPSTVLAAGKTLKAAAARLEQLNRIAAG